MSLVGKGILAALRAEATLTAIVGTTKGIYPETMPEDRTTYDYPAIVYVVISDLPQDTKNSFADLDVVRVQFDCMAYTYEQAEDIHEALRTAIDRKPGTYDGIVFDGVQKELTRTDFDPLLKVYIWSSDYSIRVKN